MRSPLLQPAVFRALLAAFLLAFASTGRSQSYFDDIGWTELHELLGSMTPDGDDIIASVIEADASSSPSVLAYEVDSDDFQFTGKTILHETPGGSVSGHATALVGYNFFGNTTSIAPGITTVQNREVVDWILNSLNFGSSLLAPLPVLADVQNHSWIGSAGSLANDMQILRRFDASIAASNYVAVVGLNNGTGSIPNLLGHSYNAIVVGRSDGSHSFGLTTIEDAGRSKPDLVAPKGTTSEATASVSAAAAVLIEAAGGSAATGASTEVVKSALMAGATRRNETEFTWTADRDNGVNSVTGAGELNILRSHAIMTSGQKSSGIDLGTNGSAGWAYDLVSLSAPQTYFFQIPEGGLYDYGIALTWLRTVQASVGMGWNQPDATAANLNLSLYSAEGLVLGSLLATGYDDSRDLSTSGDVGNVELLAFEFLAAGNYAVQITSLSESSTSYGLAWGGDAPPNPVPEPSTTLLLGIFLLALAGGKFRGRALVFIRAARKKKP